MEGGRSSNPVADAAMDRYASGHEGAFADLYDAIAPRLYAYLNRCTRDTSRSEDLLQQTLLQIHTARATFVRGSQVMPWAFAIARRLMIDGKRKDKRQASVMTDGGDGAMRDSACPEPLADDVLHARQLANRVDRHLSTLPEGQRVAFELLKRDGLTVHEAAEVLGVTPTAVKLRAHRAYEALRVMLGDDVDRVGNKAGGIA